MSYLVEENHVIREQLDVYAKGKRIRLDASQRRHLAEKSRLLGRKILLKLVEHEILYYSVSNLVVG